VITSLRIANFKAAASVTVPLGPITVLIGPNDSGKSTILQALMALSRAADKAHLGPEQLLGCPLAVAPTNQDASSNIEISAEGTIPSGVTPQERYQYNVAISARNKAIVSESITWNGRQLIRNTPGQGTSLSMKVFGTIAAGSQPHTILSELTGDRDLDDPDRPQFEAVANDLGATLIRLDSRAIAKPSRLGDPLLDDGTGLVGIVDELLTSGLGDDKIARANEVIRKLTPHVKSVAAKLHPTGGKELHFALCSGAVIPASQMSDGVVLAVALALVSLGMGTRRVLIEEPENGLHPRQLRVIADTIRSIAIEHGTQVVLTTHSPLLLNHFGAEETLLVTRTDAGMSVRPMSKTQSFDELATEMSLGELWYNVGDSDLARPA
jgi:predicted ATPase